MENYRKEFPVTKNLVYVNHAGVSPIPLRAHQYMQEFITDSLHWGSKNFAGRIETVKSTRDNGARLLGCSSDEIAFIKSTTHGIILCARGIPFQKGDNVLIPEREFPANVIPWLALKEKGVEVRFVPERENRFHIDDFAALMDKNTRAVSVSFVEFSTGFRNAIKKIAELCHEKKVLLIVDGIQAAGVIPINVKELGIDFMSMDAHKWLLGPEGIGYFYANKDSIDKIENIFEGWLAMENFMDFLNYNQPRKKTASRFEEGAPNFAGMSGLKGSTEVLLEAGIENVYQHVQMLLDFLSEGLKRKGYVITSPRENESEKSGILCFRHPQKDMTEIFHLLVGNDILPALREGNIRISPHFYNNREEMEKIIDSIP